MDEDRASAPVLSPPTLCEVGERRPRAGPAEGNAPSQGFADGVG